MKRFFTLVVVSSLICIATKSNGQAPVVTGGQSFAINENSTVATVVGTAVASNSPTSWAITVNTTNNAFAISAAGQITVINNTDLDREATSSLLITVTATNGSGTSPGVSITINLNDLNDVTPVVTAAQSFNINENLANASVVGTVLATDGDVTATTFSSWALTSNPGGAFAINSSTGELTVATSSYLDREVRSNVVVAVTVSDGTNTSAAQNVTINLNDLNDVTPVVTAAQSFNINENLANASVVGTVLATDGDITATTFSSWALTSNPGGAFAINASTGELTVATSSYLDREVRSNVVVAVTVSDGTNTSAAQNVTINLNDLNDVTPVVTAAQSFNIDENLANASVVGTVLATDGDVTATTFSNWTLTSNPGGAFAINSSTGQLTVATSSYLDFETNPVIVIQVTVSDGTNTSAAQNVTINLNDLDEIPPIADAPDAFQTPQRLKSGVTSTSQVRSNEAGNIYLVRNGTAVTSQSQIDAAITAKNAFLGRAAAVANTGYTITIPALALINDGDYNIVSVDAAGNVSAPSAGADSWLTIDNTAPTVAITLVSASPSTATSLDFTVTFSESVTGVDIGDFVLATGTANDATGTISNLSGSGAVYTVTVNSIVGQNASGSNAILNLNLIGSPAILDVATNAFAGVVTLDNQYLVDNTKPALSDGEFTLNDNGASAETITFTMNETLGLADGAAVTGFTVSTGTASPAAVYTLATNTITLTNAAADGTWTTGTTVTYTSGSGNVVDLIGNTMNSVGPTAVTIQTVSLTAGDLAFTGFNSDPTVAGGDAIDGFSFVLLIDIPNNTTIKFTDNGWSGDGTPALTTDESTISWKSTSAMQAGTEVTITESTDNNLGTTHGTIVSITGQGNFSLSNDGDQVIAYQGASNDPTFIAGIHSSNVGTEDGTLWNVVTDVDDNNNKSALPPGLTNGVNAISFSAVTALENRQYKTTGVTLTGSAQQLRASMMTVANWNAQDNVAYTLTSGVNKFPIRPVITNVTIPAPFNYIISPALRTATFTVHDDRGSIHTGLTGNIGGFPLINLSRTNATTYTAQFVVTEGGTNVAAGNDIPLTISLTSAQGNTITSVATPNTPVAYTTPISQAGDPIDANSPHVVSINRNIVSTPTTAYSGNTGTTATSVVFRVTFSEDMNAGTLTADDFSIPTTFLTGAPSISLISAVTGTSVFDVTVTGYTGTGTIGLNYNDSEVNVVGASVTDLLGNPTKSAALAPDGSFVGQTFSIVLPTPTNEAFTLSASNITGNSVTLNWNSTNTAQIPTHFLVLAKPSASSYPPVADGTPVIDALPFIQNVVRVSGANSLIITPLNSGTSYDFIVYKYTLSPNNTPNNIDFETTAPGILNNVVTNTASVSALIHSSAPVTISSLLDGTPATDKADVLQFKIYDDGQDPISPNVMSLQLNGVSQETVTFTLREELTLAEGASVTGFSSSTGSVASAIYTGKGTTNTITLRSAANGNWTGATTISYSGTGNAEFITLGKMQAINAHSIVAGTDVIVPFASNGNFVVPAGVTSIQVEVWGGGGSAGGWDSYYGGGSQGGGGGAYSRSLLQVTPGTNYTITIGAGGASVTTVTTNLSCCIAGNNGGTSSVTGPGGSVSAQGGFGGQSSAYYAFYGTPGAGGFGLGAGGNAAAGIGDVKFSGGTGGAGGSNTTAPGAIFPPAMLGNIGGSGGSSAGTNANGNNGTGGFVGPCFGCFYSSVAPPAGGGAGAGGREGSNGLSGFIPGGGGGGSNVAINGAGADGQVRITYSTPTLTGASEWDGDNSPFKFSKLVITQGDANDAALANWQDVIAGAELFDGTTAFPATSINPTDITFDVIPSTSSGDVGFIPDAVAAPSSKLYTLRIWVRDDLNSTLAGSIDGLNLDFKVDPSIPANLVYDDVTNSNQKSSRLVNNQPAIQSGANTVEVIATQLDFTTSPNPAQLVLTNVTSTSISPDFLTRPRIRARDANGNTDLNYSASITLTNAGVITMNPNPVSMVSGLATFPIGFQYQDAGDGTLTATTSTVAANSLVPAPGNSTPVTVSYSNLTTLQPGTLITPTTYSSLNTSGFVQVFDFRVVEDNGSGGDGSPTRINQIVYTQGTGNDIADWSQAISQAQLWDGIALNPAITGTIGATTITFSGINTAGLGFVGDNAIKNYRLYITLKPNLGGTLPDDIDNRNFVFEVLDDNISLTAQSSLFTGSEAVNSGATNIAVNVIATKLQFDINPAAVLLVGKDISLQPPVPVVEALDVNNNRDLNYNSATVTVTNSLALTMTNSPGNASIVSGLLTFPNNFRFNTTGTGATLTVASTGPSIVTNATSTAFDVRGGVATTITAGALTEPLTISSLVDLTHTPAGLAVFDFNINDDPGGTPANEDDGNPTQLTSIFITSGTGNTITDWSQAIETATLSDGTNTVTVTTIDPSNYLYFDLSSPTGQLLGLVADNTTKTYVLTLWLKTALGGTLPTTIDGLRFVFDVQKANISLGVNSTTFLGTPQAQNSGAGNNLVAVVATELHFTTPSVSPAFASLNSPFAATVEARDVNNNRDLNFTGGGSTITALTNATSATMSSTPTVVGSTFSAGVFNFPGDFQFISGNNNDDVTLSITAGGISSVPFPAPFTPQIILQSSFESLLVIDPGFTPTLDLPYKDYQNIATAATSIALAQFKLSDGNGVTSDTDGASTNIETLELSITNPDNIRSLGLYLGTNLIQSKNNADFVTAGNTTVTFTGLSGAMIAPDNGSLIITVRASFYNTDANITDNEVIQLQVVDVTQNGGSQFNIIGTAPLIGGITGGALTDGNVKIEVTATRLDFTVQPVPFEGIQRALASTPQVRARDVNAIVDLDHSFVGNLTTPGAALTTTAFNFTNGIVDFTGLQYVSPGDGTITITSNGLSSASGGSIICNHVDVINVFSTYASSGVITSPNLPGGAVNRVIFGVTFNTPYSVTGEPKLNSFVINFSNPISGIFTNIRVFESTNTAFDVTDANIVTTPSISGTLTAGSNFLTVDFTGGTPRDLSLPANTQLTYFLMVDVSPTASGSTPKIQPSVLNDDTNIIISNGSVYSTQNTLGQEYSFASIFPPTLVSSYPATGQLNVDKNQPTVDLVFSVPVWSLDQKILLYDQSTGLLVQELAAVNGQYPGAANLAGTVANPLKFSLPPLLDDRVYYITIAQGDFENNIGIVDESLNEFPGFTYSGTLYFKTANPNPPILLNNNSVPVANNPTITSVTLTGATINATFDQQGTAYFLVVNQGDPAPTNAQIKGTSVYVGGTVIDRGVFAINQVNPISQFGQITAALAPSTTYNVWMYAANNALPTPIETSAPYGSIASNFAVGGAGPTLTFTSPATAQPSGPVLPIPQINVCRNSFQTLNLPLQLVEGNLGDFAGGGTQVFNLLLPSGFQFDVTTTNGLPTGPPVHGTLTLTGSDFTGTGTLTFINNTTLRVSFQNSGNTSRDNITISGLRILTTAITSGNIVRLGGNAIPAAFPDLTPIATISSFDAPTVDFTNEYTLVAFPNSSTPITILPDDQGQVELIPLPASGDYGPNAFSGSGVNINQLNVTAVTKDAPFNITLTHTDNNGCISQNPIQYTVYDSKAAIKGLSSTFCIDNINFPADATLGTPTLTQTVLFNNLGAHFMDTLRANVPFNVDPTQIINGPEWISILESLPVTFDTLADPNDPLRFYFSYRIDGAKILNANTLSGGTIPNPYSHFINTTLQGNTYYDGGSLGLVEFTGQYQNQANQSVYIPLRQNVEFFVPAVPIVEVGLSNQSALDAGVPVYCEQGGNIVINGFPAASVGSSVGFFSLENNGTIIHARDLTVAITAQADNGGNFQITLSKPANLVVGNSIQIFGVTGTLPFSNLHTITSKINDSVYVINRAFNAGSALNAAKVTISLTGFTDNSNGTAELNPTQFNNGFGDLRINYTYKSNDSPCESTGGLTIRIEPNPVALFTYGSVITPNTPLSSAICEGIPVDFNGSSSTITQGSISTYSWNFSDATNETAANPNTITAAATVASHVYIQSAQYNPNLVVTSTFGCRSTAQSVPLNVGIIPKVGFTFEGVSTATPLSFTNTTVIPAGSVGDGLGSLTWDYDDGNSATVTSNFSTPITNDYINPGRYDVSLEVTSLLGCTNELAQKVIVVPQFTPTDLVAYEADFESDGGGWQPDGFGTTPASWADGTPSKQVITLAPNNGQRIWTTSLTTPYGANERSALYSPSFDLSQLDRPMISLNTFRQLAAGEGVVIEYSIDNKNVADSTKNWIVLGQLINQQITGVGWYNGIGLPSQPGNQTTGFGWTGAQPNWIDSKHVLDPVLLQAQVVFRFALATQTASPTLDGFAIDNVRVGNRTRTILVENFKNAGRPASSNEKAESDYLKTFKDGAVGTKLVTINYHVGFPQVDPFNLDNPADPSSRALYYNIQSTPIARLDGDYAPGKASEPFSDWGEAWYDEQTLKLANAVIDPNAVVNADGSISVSVDVQAISISLPATTVLHVAVVEKLVTSLPPAKGTMVQTGENNFEFVLKKLLPSGAGTVFGQALPAGSSRSFTNFTWTPEPSRLYPTNDDLAVIAFVQNETTKEVYQAEIKDVGTDPPVVTGLENIDASTIDVYPNPANKEFLVRLPAPAWQPISIDLIDQVGKTVHRADFSLGARDTTVNVEEFAAGIYILQLRDSKGSLIRKKVMITH